jgi:enoyl-CoA hydratase/carnithine racemase
LYRWNTRAHSANDPESESKEAELQVNGFGSISRRQSSVKPMIAAVNGGAFGGGTEILMNCDLVIAAEDAVLATPEVKRGVVALMGVIPRLSRVAGHQLASEMLLLGRNLTAQEAARFGL